MNAGDRVFIVGAHPWTGYSGELVSLDDISVLKGSRWRVRLDNGVECYAATKNVRPQSESVTLKRLIEEVRTESPKPFGSGYNRIHNRHNRS